MPTRGRRAGKIGDPGRPHGPDVAGSARGLSEAKGVATDGDALAASTGVVPRRDLQPSCSPEPSFRMRGAVPGGERVSL
jgi:hypothetical protein